MVLRTTLALKPLYPKITFYLALAIVFSGISVNAQEQGQQETTYVAYNVPFQNLLKFNRFLINPTFSAVREDKTYLNFFHRSQGSQFEDNAQNYFLSYSARLNDRTGLGLSLYNQQSGIISNIGVMANYAYGVRLGEKSDLSFGFNLPYYRSSFDVSRAVAQSEDPLLDGLNDTSIITFQPGVNLSLGSFDFGLFAQNLFDYNIKSGQTLTEFNEKTFSGHFQYAHEFKNAGGIFEDGRLMPLARARVEGNRDPIFGGGLILDLPKLGWIQGGYDEFYGASAGTGFNLNKRLSFGYNFEKSLNNSLNNLGVTHEISLAYSFVPNLTKNLFAAEEEQNNSKKKAALVENLVRAEEIAPQKASIEVELEKLKSQQQMNLALIDELIFKLDSIETYQQRDLEQRFEMTMRLIKRNRENESPVDESKAAKLFFAKNSQLAVAEETKPAVEEEMVEPERKKGVFVGGAFKPIEKFITLESVGKGHYLVANVYSNEKYMNSFIEKLKKDGHKPEHFKNPDNGLNYVYLKSFDQDVAARTAFDMYQRGAYTDDLWIMHVDNPKYTKFAETKFED